MKNTVTNFNNLNNTQKVNYVKNLLFNSDINDALDVLLKNEKKDLQIIDTIIKTLKDKLIIERIKAQYNLEDTKYVKPFVYSRIIATLCFHNKQIILNNLLKKMDEGQKKEVAAYEYQNKTDVSLNSKIFNKYCLKYKQEVLSSLELDKTEVLMLDEVKEKYNSMYKNKGKKNNHVIYMVLAFIVLFIITGFLIGNCIKIEKKYEGLIYPGIYLNDINLSSKKVSELKSIIEKEKNRIESGTITVTNVNGDYEFTYKELGVKLDSSDLEKQIKDYNSNLSFFRKMKMIKENKRVKTFYLNGIISEDIIDNIILLLQNKLNVSTRNDGIIIDDNHNVYYDKGISGFKLDVDKTKVEIKEAFKKLEEEKKLEVSGKVINHEVKYGYLSSINKKVSTYTTYFVNAGNRGHNINLASTRLNGTVLLPGETFSYLKVVGPYGASNGYLPAPIYLNGDTSTANGGGVCQLASTLYMAQLKAGMQTISRRGHTFAPNYVPKGLDATVYSNTTDYKFKNNYNYPVYVVSYVKGNYLTVDIWTNENALGGKTFEPYSIASNGGYLAYLKIIQDGKVIETKYLDRSVYKAH